ncbi:hypothetical protein BaRGS_00028287 [Batillaria attramentaria]|uniref:Agmatinase n=1 Tax=Batillaria attramentaria TaxID=370345 RepID=A0ABD0JZA2_9CAEN
MRTDSVMLSMFLLLTGLDACFVGVPLDTGTSYRSGARLGPRHIRQESSLIRPANSILGVCPFEDLQVADIGDVNLNIYNLPEAVRHIKAAFSKIIANGCIPLTMGGDHTITYPILQAMKIAHGTPFRRAAEEGCLDCNRAIQIGLRGTIYTTADYQWARDQGFRVVTARECWYKSLEPLMAEVKSMMGDRPVYLSFDIDGLDPSFAPGTGTPEIGGLTIYQGIEIIHGCRGLNVVGADLVEVSPPYDVAGITSLTAANLLHEMLCVLPGVKKS